MNILLRLTKVELLKLRKHRLTWGVLLALTLVLGLQMNSLRRAAHEHPLSETTIAEAGAPPPTADGFDMSIFNPPIANQDYWQAATLPGVFTRFWRMVDWLNIAVIALGIVFVGQEFSWGMMRMTLVRGVARSQIAWSKFLALGLTTAVYLLILWLETAVLGWLLTRSLSGAIDWSFLNGSFWLEQIGGIGRMWLIILPFIAFTLAVNIGVARPGPAFSLLFMIYFLSLFSYMTLLVTVIFIMAQTDFDPVSFSGSFFGKLMQWLPHYNSRIVLYWGEPDILAEGDYNIRQMVEWLQFSIAPWLSLGRLWLYGFISLLAALYSFKRREMTP